MPPPCRAAAGLRTPAAPRPRGTSVRPASELPPLRDGDLLRALPRLRQQAGIVVPASQAVRRPLLWSRKNGFPLVIRCNGLERRCVCRSSEGFSLLFGTGWRILSALVDGIFFGLTLMADVARHPGVVACAASGRGQGLAQPLAPYDPQPRVGAAIPDGQHDYASNALCPLSAARQRAFGLPLSRARAGRAFPLLTAWANWYAVPRPRGTSVRPASELPPLRGGDLLRALPRLRQQAGIVVPASQAVRRPLLWSRKNGFPLVIRCNGSERRSRGEENAPRSPGHEP